MGYNQKGSFVIDQSILQHLFGWDIEVVGWLIQHQQIAWAQQHQSQCESCFLSAAQLAHLLENGVIAEAETAQQRSHLGLGPVGDRFEHGVDHRFVQVEGFGLVLFEISGHHVVFSEACGPFVRLLRPHHEAEQGGFACSVGADKGDAVTPFHLQFSAKKENLVSVAVGEVVNHSHLRARAGCRREPEARTRH